MYTVIRKHTVRCLNCGANGSSGVETSVRDRENCGVTFTLCDECASRLFEAVDGVTRASTGKEAK